MDPALGVTLMTSPTFPDRGEIDAPRAEASFQAPAGPSTLSFTGPSNAFDDFESRRYGSGCSPPLRTGHSFGDFQSYGPHSSTMIVSRPRRAPAASFASMPSTMGSIRLTS